MGQRDAAAPLTLPKTIHTVYIYFCMTSIKKTRFLCILIEVSYITSHIEDI